MGNTTAEVVNDAEKFAVSIDVSQFKPEELKVNLDGHVLTIEGNHERKDDHNFMKRSFVRKWTFPDDVDLAAVRSLISEEGHLSIEAPKTNVLSNRDRRRQDLHRLHQRHEFVLGQRPRLPLFSSFFSLFAALIASSLSTSTSPNAVIRFVENVFGFTSTRSRLIAIHSKACFFRWLIEP